MPWFRIRFRDSPTKLEHILELARQRDEQTGKQKGFAVLSGLEYDRDQPQEAWRLVYFSPVAAIYAGTILDMFSAMECEVPSPSVEGLRVVHGADSLADLLK